MSNNNSLSKMRRGSGRKSPTFTRLALERLEAREVPAVTLLWVGGANGNPAAAASWALPNGKPQAPDGGENLTFNPGQVVGFGTADEKVGTDTSPSGFTTGFAIKNLTMTDCYTGTVRFDPTTHIGGEPDLQGGTLTTGIGADLGVRGSDAKVVWRGGKIGGRLDVGANGDPTKVPMRIDLRDDFELAGNLFVRNGVVKWDTVNNVNLSGSIQLGVDSEFDIVSTGSLKSVGGAGRLNLIGGKISKTEPGAMEIDVPFESDNGVMEITAGELKFTKAVSQYALGTGKPSTRLFGGSLTVAAGFDLKGGRLEGLGVITGDVRCDKAEITPTYALAPTQLTLAGNLTLKKDSVLSVVAKENGAAFTEGKVGYLKVTGNVTLAGQLSVIRSALFVPNKGTPAAPTRFDVLTWGGAVSGKFTEPTDYGSNNEWAAPGMNRYGFKDGFEPAPAKAYSLRVVDVKRLGGGLWLEAMPDGTRTAGETAVVSAIVNLYDSVGGLVATTLTGADGAYAFIGVAAGESYFAEFVAPSNRVFTLRDQGDDATDSDVDSTGRSAPFTLTADTVIDAGLVAVGSSLASVAGSLWADDGDGIREADEAAVPGVAVSLLDADGAVVATTATDSAGDYVFSGRDQGFYRVRFGTPSGASGFTTPDAGSDAFDSDVVSAGDTAFALLGAAGLDLDAGVLGLASAAVSGRVWDDADADGVQDSGESGVSGVTVRLLNASNAVVATTTTSYAGAYRFAALAGGSYRVEVVAASGMVFTLRDRGGNDAVDSDVDKSGRSPLFTLTANTAVDAGSVSVGTGTISIGGSVWADDGDGVREAGEAAVAGVLVYLIDADGTVVGSAYTNSSGDYVFSGLARGFYRLDFELPAGYVNFTQQNAGPDDALDSDVDSSGLTAFALFDGTGDDDAGVLPPAGPGGGVIITIP